MNVTAATTAVLTVVLGVARARAGEPAVTARAAIVMDAASGAVLWERNASWPLPPASTTKVMTAILAVESGRLDESLRVSSAAAGVAPSKIGLRPGQRMKLRNLLYALLLNSANDAAAVVAEGLAGSESQFAVLMNERARQLGAETAHFGNPHGLTAPGHVASARDLALIFRHAIRQPLIREVLETRSVRVPVEAVRPEWVTLRSHNRLLAGYEYPVIGKTGYTRPARRCFVGAAMHDDREIIVALLGASDLWGDAKRLFALGFGEGTEAPPTVVAGQTSKQRLAQRERAAASEGDDEAPADARRRSAASRYMVQLGPYRSRRTATGTRARLARRGYTAILWGRTLRVGSFSRPASAQRLASRLRASGYESAVVVVR